MNDLYLDINFYVAGVKHHQFYEAAGKLKEGMQLDLIREPNNKFDKYAVRILLNDFVDDDAYMLGYVPASISKMVSEKIAAGENLVAKIAAISLEKEPWYALRIKVEEVD